MKHMISAKELNRLGLPDDPRLMPLALKLANTFQAWRRGRRQKR